jgi:2-(1,2-epoxy-1,2-dihydrophenyl)acetyl-CoA isomerase
VGDHYNPIVSRIRSIEKPIIAAVNGVAAGAGANMALACDIVFAKKSASFIQAFSKIGLIPDSGGTYFLPRIIGMQKAMALMMTGDKVSAEEAEEMTMIYKAVEDEDFDETVMTFAEKLSKMPTRALGLTKKAVNSSYNNTMEEQLDLEENLQNEASKTNDFDEGVQAFLEKRTAKFTGK